MRGHESDVSRRRLRFWGWAALSLALVCRTFCVGVRIVGGEASVAAGGALEFLIFVIPLWLGAALAWRWPKIGASLLLLDGVTMAVVWGLRVLTFYLPLADSLTTAITAVSLPVVAGALLVASAWGGRGRVTGRSGRREGVGKPLKEDAG